MKSSQFFFFLTGIIGKWHLGLHSSSTSDFHFHPLKQGFQYFFGLPLTNVRDCEPAGSYVINLVIPGFQRSNILIAATIIAITLYICYRNGLLGKCVFYLLLAITVAIAFALCATLILFGVFNCFLMKNYEVVEQPINLENLTMKFTDEAVNFIRANKDGPFLLYMSYAKVHTPLFNTKAFVNHSAHGRYGDNVEEMDWSVGQVMAAVEKLDLKENTFVYFTSDNGPSSQKIDPLTGECQGGWKSIYKGGKLNSYSCK